MLLFPVSPLVLASVIGLAVIVVALLLYYLVFYGRFAFRKEKGVGESSDFPPISIVITARDEAHHLIQSLPLLLSQDYPKFEVVLVNDKSRDETPQIVLEYKSQFPNLHYVNLETSISNLAGKKFPLANGIQAAKYDLLVFTDASCVPASPYWLQNIASKMLRKKKVVLGHTTFASEKGLLSRWLHYDALLTSVQAFSYNIAGMPVMANGNNMAYDGSLFFSNREAFVAQARMPFGEDAIFISKVAKPDSVAVSASPDAVIVQPKMSFSKWFQEKKYALVNRSFYKFAPRFWMKLFNWLNFLFYAAFALAAAVTVLQQAWICLGIAAALLALRVGMQYLIFAKSAKKLNEREAIPLIFLFDLLMSLLQPWICLASKFEKSKWK